MATVTRPETVVDVLKDVDFYTLVYQYKGPTGKILYALFSDPRYCDIYQSPFVFDPVCLMSNGMLTEEGKAWLGANG